MNRYEGDLELAIDGDNLASIMRIRGARSTVDLA